MAEVNEKSAFDTLRADLSKLTSQIENAVKSMRGEKEAQASDLTERLIKELEHLRDGASERAKKIYSAGSDGMREVGEQVRENPLLSLLIAFGAGCVLSCLFRNLSK